jgi:hypothetical protein
MDEKQLLGYCQRELGAMLDCLRQTVEIESPSDSKPGVDRLAAFFAKEFKRCKGQVQLLKHPSAGSALKAAFWPGKRKQNSLVVLGVVY